MWYFLEAERKRLKRESEKKLGVYGEFQTDCKLDFTKSCHLVSGGCDISSSRIPRQFSVGRVLPQGGSVRDGEQRDAGVLRSLENLSLHVDAHGAGALIQQSILRPDTHRGNVKLCWEIICMCKVLIGYYQVW